MVDMKETIGKYLIRDWRWDDVKSLVKYANNAKIAANLRDGFPYPYLVSDAEAFLGQVISTDLQTYFAICTDTEAIGGIGLTPGEDVHRLTAELGYWLGEPFWNEGIMTSAVRAMVQYAFDGMGLNRVYAVPYASNKASARVLEKAQFVKEGVLHASVIKQGRVLDQIMYARVRDDFM